MTNFQLSAPNNGRIYSLAFTATGYNLYLPEVDESGGTPKLDIIKSNLVDATSSTITSSSTADLGTQMRLLPDNNIYLAGLYGGGNLDIISDPDGAASMSSQQIFGSSSGTQLKPLWR